MDVFTRAEQIYEEIDALLADGHEAAAIRLLDEVIELLPCSAVEAVS